MTNQNHSILLELTCEIVAAYVSSNPVPARELPDLIAEVSFALARIQAASKVATSEGATKLIVPIDMTITDDYIISLEDGKRYKALRRHLTSRGLTPDEYKMKWNLPQDYPMVSANYSKNRTKLAREQGLGRKPTPLRRSAK